MKSFKNYTVISAAVSCCLLLFSCGQESKNDIVTLDDYRRAESFLSVNTSKLVSNQLTSPTWIADDLMLYKVSREETTELILVDLQEQTKQSIIDADRLANSLSGLTERDISSESLRLTKVSINEDRSELTYSLAYQGNTRYTTNLADYTTTSERGTRVSSNEILSPDKSKTVYIKDHNLWVRDLKTDRRTQLTFDGEEDYGYGTNNAGWTKRNSPVVKWSPQSDKIATFRHDGRNVGEMYLWSTKVGHPDLEKWKYPLPGDSLIFRIERVVLHLDGPRMVKLNMPPDPHRSTTTDHIAGRGGEFLDVEWSEDGELLSFVSSSRDHKVAHLKLANPYSGEITPLHREEQETYFESGVRMRNWHILKESNEFIWYSEKSNWGHLYLYDLKTGELKNPITQGDWAVLQLHHIDQENRQLYFIGSNKEDGDPYYQYLYKVNFDGTELKLLTPEMASHSINWSPNKKYFIDTYGTPTEPNKSVIRDLEGEIVMELEETDISQLIASGWVAPIPFTVLARDQETMLYGIMYKPSNLDPDKKYPILNYLYPGPQSGSVGSRLFSASRRDKQAVAELGFIVVEVDAMGTPGRSKSFHDAYYGNMGDNGLPDQMTMIEQLAERNPEMDLSRVGIWGHSGGGFASTDAILRYPDFYHVAVSGAGNHDNRNYEDDWGEKWHGLLVENESAGTGSDNVRVDVEIQEEAQGDNYDSQANQLMAGNLKGKLLIAHGMMDGNVHPSNTLLVVDALIEADKDFDMLVFPNARHGFGNSRYFMKRRWDYFVEHLKGVNPPEDFVFAENVR